MASDQVINPFHPGAGLSPSYMGHRAEIEQPLLDMLAGFGADNGDRTSIGALWNT